MSRSLISDRATHPLGPNLDWKTINAFADRVSESQDVIPTALRLLVHRIQSSDEQEALNGLLVGTSLLCCCVCICLSFIFFGNVVWKILGGHRNVNILFKGSDY